MTTHEELMAWLARDKSHIDRFIKALDKIVRGRVVLVAGEDGDSLITCFRASRRNRRVRR